MRTVQGWKKAARVLEGWRRRLTPLQVALKRPREIDIVPVNFITGEAIVPPGPAKKKFKGQLIYFTRDDVTVRRAGGALLVIDTYELESLSDGKTRLHP